MIDTEALAEHLSRARGDVAARLVEQSRFVGAARLVSQFEEASSAILENPKLGVHQVNSRINELCLAELLLRALPADFSLHYEPPLAGTDRTIDFVALGSDGGRRYFDVKTIDPEWQDGPAAQSRYERSREYVPSNILLAANGPSYHHMQASRSKFLLHTLDLEEKIALLTLEEQGHYKMVFCGNGFSWHRDELEDFADFYRSGRHRQDDAFSQMETHAMSRKGLSLVGSIDEFCYLFRKTDALVSHEARCGVRGPKIGA